MHICVWARLKSQPFQKQADHLSVAACMQILEPWHFDDKPEELGPPLQFREHSFLAHPGVQAAIEVRPPSLDMPTLSMLACLDMH